MIPLGLVAVLSSITAASGARQSRYAEVTLLADVGARHLTQSIAEARLIIQPILGAIDTIPDAPERCDALLSQAMTISPRMENTAILTREGRPVCASDSFNPALPASLPQDGEAGITVDRANQSIQIVLAGAQGRAVMVVELSRQNLALLPQPDLLDRNYEIALTDSEGTIVLRPWDGPVDTDEVLSASQPIPNTDLSMKASYVRTPLTTGEIFTIALPIAMWVLAALLGWLGIALLLIRPLEQLRQAVVRHADGEGDFEIPLFSVPADEIKQLAAAFESSCTRLKYHEDELAHGLEEQTRLTREVHHRVKNNLQIIASLLNLHARAAKSDDSAAAYASIQRRVDALAIVQRNLFAQLEKTTGLPLRPVIAELASGLQQSAPPNIAMAITMDVDPIRVSQDIAAPVAFLITELVELAMLCDTRVEIAISAKTIGDDIARLALRSDALATAAERDEFSRYRRVLTGMARQLRTSLDEEEGGTLFTVKIPIL